MVETTTGPTGLPLRVAIKGGIEPIGATSWIWVRVSLDYFACSLRAPCSLFRTTYRATAMAPWKKPLGTKMVALLVAASDVSTMAAASGERVHSRARSYVSIQGIYSKYVVGWVQFRKRGIVFVRLEYSTAVLCSLPNDRQNGAAVS